MGSIPTVSFQVALGDTGFLSAIRRGCSPPDHATTTGPGGRGVRSVGKARRRLRMQTGTPHCQPPGRIFLAAGELLRPFLDLVAGFFHVLAEAVGGVAADSDDRQDASDQEQEHETLYERDLICLPILYRLLLQIVFTIPSALFSLNGQRA